MALRNVRGNWLLKTVSAKKATAKLISVAISLMILWFLYRKLDLSAILRGSFHLQSGVAAPVYRHDHSYHLGQRIAISVGVHA